MSKHLLRSWTFRSNVAALGGVWGLSSIGVLSLETAWVATGITGLNILLRLITSKPIHLY